MAEDENVDIMSMNAELAERLGVVPVPNSGDSHKPGFRARGRSPLLNASSNPRPSCASACRTHDPSENLLVPELGFFIHLLPQEVISADKEHQALLFQLVFDAGVKAYHHLLQYVIATGTSPSESSSSNSSETSWSTSRAFRDAPVLEQDSRKSGRFPSVDSDTENMSMMERIDQAYETMIEVGDADIAPVGNAPEATPQLVANTLGLFAGAALRRPPTRAVECVMAASQESNTAQSDVDRHEIYENQPNVSENSFASCEDGLLILSCAAGFVELVTEILHLRDSTVFSSEIDVTPLMESAAAGSHTVVKKLLELKADVNAVSQANNTALIYAAAAGQAECVRLLLSTGIADVTLQNDNGHDALMEAASSGNVDVVKMLVDAGARPNFVNMHSEFKESPLTLASYKGHVDVVTFLLELCDVFPDVNYQEEEMHTALMEASMDGHYEVARVLLDAGAPPNMASESFESPLTLACCGGHDVLAKMLLDAGAYIEEPNDESYTPLMEAAREGHGNVVKVLLEHGANVNAQTEETGETALTVAACGGYTDVLEELVKHGGDLELGGNTPLMEAAQEGHAQTVMYIVKASKQPGACPNFMSHAATAVGLSAENGHLDVIEILYNAGADLNTEIDGRTPLMKAAKNGNALIVQYLVNHNVDVNIQSSHQDATALLLACASGHKDIVKMLLHHGADPNIELKDGISCVLEAARNGYVEIVELILDHNGVTANVTTAHLPNVPKPAQATSNVSNNPSQQKVVALRRKKIPAKALVAPPDPSVNGPPVYSHSFPAAIIASQNMDGSKIADFYSNPEFGREYYAWLAGIYNSRIGDQTAFVNTTLPSDLTGGQIVGHLENLQKMMQQLAQSDDNWIRPDHMEFAMHRARQQVSQVHRDGIEIANGVKNPEKTTGIAATSAKFLASIYELGKKNFAGLPLPAGSKQHPPNPPGTSAPQQTASLGPSANASLTQSAQAASQLNAMTMEQMAEIMAFFKTNPNQDGEDIISQITATLSPEHRRATKKKFMEIFNNWEGYNTYTQTQVFTPEFTEECRKLCPDLTKPTTNNDLSAVLEQQTAALNETLKVLRPTVTTLPGGIVAGATTTANLPPVAFPTSSMATQPSSHTVHRRTHSEGDDSENLKQNLPAKNGGPFNVDKATESNNDTPLSLACSNGHKEMVSVLVSRGANIEHRDKKGFTPLILASTGGHVNVVEALLTAGANIEAQSERTKDTALSLACSGGRKEVVELLLAKGANKEHRNVSDYTPLSLAASGGYVDIVNMLLNAGAEINSRTGSKLGISPLMLAAMNGHKDATRVLLEKGSDINAQIETNRNTALTLACFQGRTDVVRLLLQYNANVEHRAKTGLTPLMEAANGGYVEVGELLLENYADPNTTPVPSSRDTALTIAADKGHDKFVEMLLKHGALLDARNKKGCTALWLACHGGHLDTVQVLIRHNADVDAQDNRKVSPLMIAFRKGFVRIVSYLVNHVKQYPSDQEMERYMATLTVGDGGKSTKDIQDLMKNCEESMNIIKKAKTAQAEQANKAAEDLLALLAEEEERAKNKKQKKAKKREEKKQKQKGSKVKSPLTEGYRKSEDESDDESEVNNVSREENSVAPVELRVPHVIETQLENTPQQNVSIKQKKQARRTRQELVKAPVVLAPTALTVTTVPKSLIVSPASPIIAPPKGSPTEEWVKANPTKKKMAQKKSAALHQSKVQDFFSDESGAYGGWKDVELSRRRSNTLTVCNTVIARVIGRGGTNINAIREATGASIEVEKQNTKRDQPERQICIRGTTETVRNATCMINGLIADNDIAVNDIIRQVLRGNISVASSSSESGKVAYLPDKIMASSTSVKSNPGTTPVTTNVWQQRMAARAAMQKAQSKESTNTSLSELNNRVSPKISMGDDIQQSLPDTYHRSSPISSPTLAPVATVSPLPPYNTEEDLRKAPGYRPHTAPSINASSEATSITQTCDRDTDLSECCVLAEERLLPIGHGFARAPGAKILNEEPTISKTSAGKDLGRLSFLEKPEIADIWKGDGKDSANEPAWGSQLLLGNGLGNMLGNLNLVSSEWGSSLSSNDFNSAATSNVLNNKVSTTTTSYDWIGTSTATMTQSNPLYSRPTTTTRTLPLATPTTSTAPSTRESLYQQLAAQLLNQQNTGNQPSNNYYSNSYSENPMNSAQQQSSAHKSYVQAYQSANQEFENLNNLLNSYSTTHYGSNGDYGQNFAGASVASRPLQSRPSSYAPPPGFANVTPTPGLNSNSPVPLMRPYYNTTQPPLPQNTSAFSAYGQQPHQSQQQNNWSKLNANGAPGSSWNSGGWN